MFWYLAMCAPECAYGLELNELERLSSRNRHYKDPSSSFCDGS
jgi:hypothetical protein